MTTLLKRQILFISVFCNLSLQAQVNHSTGNTAPDSSDGFTKIETGFSAIEHPDKNLFSTEIDFTRLKPTNELSVPEFLQGKISGLGINCASGVPGGSAQTFLRGYDISGIHSPLIVIDGIPQKNLDIIFKEYNYNSEDIRSLIPVSLEDVQSVEVLKDGFSTSLYGAEGVNGVIRIETKKGRQQKMRLTYQLNQSIVKEPSFKPMLSGNEYTMYQVEALHNTYGVIELPPEITYDRDFSGFYNYSANTDWLEAVTQPGNASNHFLNISGGNEKNRYYGSLNYLDQKGPLINTGYNRLISRLNFEHYFTKKLTLAFNVSYANNRYHDNVVIEDENDNGNDIFEMAFIKAPNMSILEYDAEGNRTGSYFSPVNSYQGRGYDYFNPIAVSESGNSVNRLNDLMTTTHLQYKLKDWLGFRESLMLNRSSAVSKAYLPASALGLDLIPSPPVYIENTTTLKLYQLRNELQTLLKIPFKHEKKNLLNGTFTWIMQKGLYSIEPGNEGSNHNSDYDKNINAVVTSVYYKLLDRYTLSVNTRTESFPTDQNRKMWDSHYGIAMGWRFSGEPFFKKPAFLNNGIIHAGWSLSEYHPAGYFPEYNTSNDDEIRNTQSCNVGIELSFFNDRIHLKTDYYSKKNEFVYNYPGYPSSAFKMKNQGWEFMSDFELIRTESLNWMVHFNIAQNNNRVTETPDWINNGLSATLRNGEYVEYITENTALGSIYGLINEGVYATDQDAVALDKDGNILLDNDGIPVSVSYKPEFGARYIFTGGDAKFRDINYDGIIDENDVVNLGNSFPKITGGSGSTIQFRNITLTCNFHFRSGYKIINQTALASEGLHSRHNQNKNMLNRWRIQGQEGKDLLPRAYVDHPANYLGSDAYVENGRFFKMNYVSLGYNFKPEICQKIHVRELFVSLSAQRLLTFSKYSGTDPEIEMNNRLNKDEIRLNPPKIYTLNIRILL